MWMAPSVGLVRSRWVLVASATPAIRPATDVGNFPVCPLWVLAVETRLPSEQPFLHTCGQLCGQRRGRSVATPAADDLWARVAAAVRAQLAEATWNTWFQGVHALDLTEDTIVLGVPGSVAVERLRTSYLGLLVDAVHALTGVPITVELIVDTAPRLEERIPLDVPAPVNPIIDEPVVVSAEPEVLRDSTTSLNARYTFDDFVIGASNRFAHAAALSVAESPARSYNP